MVRSALTPLVIAGPTAAGKSALALALAASEPAGVVVCADSRQVYEGMRVGTAAPDADELTRAPHAGYNVVPPEERYDAGRFLQDTDRLVEEVQRAGRRPILVGGSGLYLRSWRFGLSDVPARDDAVRERLEREVEEQGAPALHARLKERDPASADRIEANDPIRVVRALEILEVTGERPSALRRSHAETPPRVDARWLLLEAEASWLRPRLRARVAAMFERGLVDEACALRERLGPGHRLLSTMAYEEALAVADGALPRADAVEIIEKRQWQYARRQRTWFKKEPWWERAAATRPIDELVVRARRA